MSRVDLYKKIGFILATVFFILDRLLKSLAISSHKVDWSVGEWLRFNFISNVNIAFSLPVRGYWLNFLVAIVIISLIVYCIYMWQKKQTLELLCLVSMILGATSNLYDRFVYGFVIDYIDLKFFTVFNLADALVVVGVCVLLWMTIKEPQVEDPQQQIPS